MALCEQNAAAHLVWHGLGLARHVIDLALTLHRWFALLLLHPLMRLAGLVSLAAGLGCGRALPSVPLLCLCRYSASA